MTLSESEGSLVMPDADRDPVLPGLSSDQRSRARHELVTPINLIIGYCELLTAEAGDHCLRERIDILQSIRQLGFALLRSIDGALLGAAPAGSTGDLQQLGFAIRQPAQDLVARCRQFVAQAELEGDQPQFLGDLDKILTAGEAMIGLADMLINGCLPWQIELEP